MKNSCARRNRPAADHARGKANSGGCRCVAGRRPTGERRSGRESRQTRRRARSTAYRQIRFRQIHQRARAEHPVFRRVGRERYDLRDVDGEQQLFSVPVHRDLQHDRATGPGVVAAGLVPKPVPRGNSDEQKYRVQRLRCVRNVEKRRQTVSARAITHASFEYDFQMEFGVLQFKQSCYPVL